MLHLTGLNAAKTLQEFSITASKFLFIFGRWPVNAHKYFFVVLVPYLPRLQGSPPFGKHVLCWSSRREAGSIRHFRALAKQSWVSNFTALKTSPCSLCSVLHKFADCKPEKKKKKRTNVDKTSYYHKLTYIFNTHTDV